MRVAAAAAAGGTRGAGVLGEALSPASELEGGDEEAAAATPLPARSPRAAFPAPPPAFARAPALEAMAAAETAKALGRSVCGGKKREGTEEQEEEEEQDVERHLDRRSSRVKKSIAPSFSLSALSFSFAYRRTVPVLYPISRRKNSPASFVRERKRRSERERARGSGKNEHRNQL